MENSTVIKSRTEIPHETQAKLDLCRQVADKYNLRLINFGPESVKNHDTTIYFEHKESKETGNRTFGTFVTSFKGLYDSKLDGLPTKYEQIPRSLEMRMALCLKIATLYNVTLIDFTHDTVRKLATMMRFRSNSSNIEDTRQVRNFITHFRGFPENRKKEVAYLESDRRKQLEESAERLHVEVLNADTINLNNIDSKVKYRCLKHNYFGSTPFANFVAVIKRARCCENEHRIQGFSQELLDLCEKRKHVPIPVDSTQPVSMKCPITLYCSRHNCKTRTTGEQYLKRKYGIFCCAFAVRNANWVEKDQVYFPKRGHSSVAWRKPAKIRAWSKAVYDQNGRVCFFTGISILDKRLEVHHLYSGAYNEALRYEPLNGIPMLMDLHRKFHSQLGTQTPVTPSLLIRFLSMYVDKNGYGTIELKSLKGETYTVTFTNFDEKVSELKSRDFQLKQILLASNASQT